MKKVEYIGEGNAWILESGDKLHFKASESMLDGEIPWWEGPEEFDITVHSTFLTSIHGARIFSTEKIGLEQCDDFYLRDDWTVTVVSIEGEDD